MGGLRGPPRGGRLQLCIRKLVSPKGVYGVVPGSESAVGVLRTYHEGSHYGDAIHHQHAHTPRAQRIASKAAINSVGTPLTRSPPPMCTWTATKEELQTDLTWMLQRPYTFILPTKLRDHGHLARPTCSNGCRSNRPAPRVCNMSTGGNQTMSGAGACHWIGLRITSKGTWWPTGCATSRQ